jgi:hypothetical protein
MPEITFSNHAEEVEQSTKIYIIIVSHHRIGSSAPFMPSIL